MLAATVFVVLATASSLAWARNASRPAAESQEFPYDAAGVRVVKREGASTTLYLAPDFEVRDGLATTYVKAGHTSA